MRLRRAVLGLAVGGVVAVGAAGCGKNPGAPPANLPPATFLFLDIPASEIANPSHLVAYRQPMHWWGTDTDGTVSGYEWRIITLTLAGADSAMSEWAFTTRTDSTFDFPAASPIVRRAFEIRALDDQGTADPHPVRQELYLRNDPPTVSFKRSLVPASALPALTVYWTARDPQGVSTLDRYLLWAKGTSEAGAIVVHAPDSSGTLGPAMLDGPDGLRTIYVRAVDRGGMTGALDSVTVTIQGVTGSVLVVDDCPSTTPASLRAFYPAEVTTAVGAGRSTKYTVTDLGALRSAPEADSLLRLFTHVVYYREANATLASYSQTLRFMNKGLQALLARGGGVYLAGPVVAGSDSSLSSGVTALPDTSGVFPASGFARSVLGIDAFHAHIIRDAQVTYDTNFTFGKDGTGTAFVPFAGNPVAGTDTMETGFNAGFHNPPTVYSAETFELAAADLAAGTVKVLWELPAHSLDDQDAASNTAHPYPVALLSTKAGGRIAYLSYSLRLLNFRGNAAAQFQKVLNLIGIPRQ